MVALKTPRAPRPSCDRYGHPVCSDPATGQCEPLRTYLETHEAEIAVRWKTLYRQLYHDGGHHVTDDRLVTAVETTLHELERSGPESTFKKDDDEETLGLIKQVCLTGFECHGRLVPETGWADQRSLQEVREQLRRRLFCLVQELVD